MGCSRVYEQSSNRDESYPLLLSLFKGSIFTSAHFASAMQRCHKVMLLSQRTVRGRWLRAGEEGRLNRTVQTLAFTEIKGSIFTSAHFASAMQRCHKVMLLSQRTVRGLPPKPPSHSSVHVSGQEFVPDGDWYTRLQEKLSFLNQSRERRERLKDEGARNRVEGREQL